MSCPVDRLTADFDHHDPEFTPDLALRVHRAVRGRGRVAHSSAHGGMWVLSHHADVDAALRDHETFASGHGVFFPRAAGTPRFAPLEYDPPEQTRYRALMRPPFTPARAKESAAAITGLVAELVRPVVERGHGDLVAELATPLPLAVVGAAVGFSPEARARIRELTSNTWKGMPRDADSGGFWPPFAELFRTEIRRARENPGDDHLSTLVRTRVDGELLTEDDLHVMLVAYAIAGHETTMNTIGHLCWVLARRPDLQDLLREHPDLRPRAVEETLRLWAPVDHGTRFTTREVEVGGTTIPAGARVVLLTGAANRDPAVFDDPDEFRLDRPHNRHLTFGQGVHFCLGAHHARTEFLAVLDELARHGNYRLTAEPTRYFENGRHICVDRLPVEFD
ncbi:cytochrome P450 [Actinokineospora spheciospongiae]|uniref:cytochrome P450 n=1 Tax=Actinokineospora spheciospongiae TaxID=909613 RepID=UPI000D713398|nr:cytochrome P450 [Actinokineospora spheciospongiae]PWW66771.1 cytochrome P450 [Actinokineospora spheciospongiae]